MKYQENCLFFKIIGFEFIAVKSPYYGENTWHR